MQSPVRETTTVLRQVVAADEQPWWRRWVIGAALATEEAPHQTIGKAVGLAVFASDALSSTAYATQEILVVLAAAGAAAFGLSIPVSIAIVSLLAIVTFSYQQTIHAYPGGGGAYIVARDNLGELAAQTAGAALLTDYVLTVSVSVSSGVEQIASAFPALDEAKVLLAVLLVVFIMLVNLRGVKESGAAFALPTYFFVVMMYCTVGLGLLQHLTGGLGKVIAPPTMEHVGELRAVGMFLILHAFANGTTALTGIEAISNGITAFREPRSRNAAITLIWMACILSSLFLCITFLAHHIGAVPSDRETVISQLARTIYGGRNALYLMTIGATTVILVMAANTSFADFPRLGALQAADGFLPRQLAQRGSRLVFSRGIVTLAVLACLLIVAFRARVTALIPLYAIGVFLSFTLSQAGMARRWWKSHLLQPGEEVTEPGSVLRFDPRWRVKMVVNAFGSVATFIVMVVFAATKFAEGAWVVLVLIPLLVAVFLSIHRHYRALAQQLSVSRFASPPRLKRHRVIMPVSNVHSGTLQALQYATTLSHDVTAVHVSFDPAEAEELRRKWGTHGQGVRLVILHSPYRSLLKPLVQYIEAQTANRQPDEVMTVIVPQFVPSRWWQNFLHMQTATWLRMMLLSRPGVYVTDVPYHVV
ncbi:MAG: APC family permease [Armatimonadetes bacterium]|nr:APC family permease [Armatimonadota bacterium]